MLITPAFRIIVLINEGFSATGSSKQEDRMVSAIGTRPSHSILRSLDKSIAKWVFNDGCWLLHRLISVLKVNMKLDRGTLRPNISLKPFKMNRSPYNQVFNSILIL